MAIADGANGAKELSRPPAQRGSLPPSLQRPPPRARRAAAATTTRGLRGPRTRSGSAGRNTISTTTGVSGGDISGGDMDYAWMEPKHDPIATDTNLAEIDFEDFRNEDLAYAFSCEEESGSSTDMSICRSEVLFSSMRDSATTAAAYGTGGGKDGVLGAEGDCAGGGDHLTMAAADSLIMGQDGCGDFSYSEQVKVNKNNYTLTFSRSDGSMIASTTSASGCGTTDILADIRPTGTIIRRKDRADENNSIPTTVPAFPTEKDDLSTEQGASGSSSTGKLTTWSNIGKQSSSGSRPGREENNNNNSNGDSGDFDRPQDTRSRKSRSLDDMGGDRLGINTKSGEEDVGGGAAVSPNEGRLLNAFMRNRGEHLEWDENAGAAAACLATDTSGVSPSGSAAIPMMRSKDTVNQFLKAAATRQLTSIEENSGEQHPTFAGVGATVAVIPVPAEYSSSKPPLPPRSHPRKLLGSGANADAPSPVSSSASSSVRKYPDLNFLENDVGLWDAFFMHGKNSSKFPSVLRHPQQIPPPPHPPHSVAHPAPPGRPPSASADYSAGAANHRQKRNSIPAVLDSESLKTLLPPSAHKHLLAEEAAGVGGGRASPITQVCQSLSRITSKNDLQNEALKSMFGQQQQQQQQQQQPQEQEQQQQRRRLKGEGDGVKVVKVKEAWAEVPAREQVVMRRARKEKDERNMNLINNNNSKSQQEQDSGTKRRSYHPQDYLSQVLVQDGEGETRHRGRRRKAEFPKSGSQNDLCDTWTPEEEEKETAASFTTSSRTPRNIAVTSAEYPFHANVCMPPQGINFDLTHKRGLFVHLYNAVERLLMYQDDDVLEAPSAASNAASNSASARYILFHEFCPALHAIMLDGLKPEVITSFGRMETSVWRLVEAVTRSGQTTATSTCDLVMLLNSRFDAAGEDERKFAGFIVGLLNMASLHLWFSKLKWNMDVLLRFYERHAFVCALHKETRLLVDELIFCLQRLYSIPFRVEMPFSDNLLEQVPHSAPLRHRPPPQPLNMHTSGCTSCATSGNAATLASTPDDDDDDDFSCRTTSSGGARSRSGGKSRIPRPISLPKRLEAKLGKSPSPVRSAKIKGQLMPTPPPACSAPTKASARKSRVRDAIKIFDASEKGSSVSATMGVARRVPSIKSRSSSRPLSAVGPRTGAGEAMVTPPDGNSIGSNTTSGGGARRGRLT